MVECHTDLMWELLSFGEAAMGMSFYITLFSGASWVCVHIRCCGHGHLGFRSYSGSLLEKSPKSNQKGSCPTTRHLA